MADQNTEFNTSAWDSGFQFSFLFSCEDLGGGGGQPKAGTGSTEEIFIVKRYQAPLEKHSRIVQKVDSNMFAQGKTFGKSEGTGIAAIRPGCAIEVLQKKRRPRGV